MEEANEDLYEERISSILLFHSKDTVCHNKLPLICTSSKVKLRPASDDDKLGLAGSYNERARLLCWSHFSQLADKAFNASMHNQSNFDYSELSLHVEAEM